MPSPTSPPGHGPRPSTPRIAPLAFAEMDDHQRELMENHLRVKVPRGVEEAGVDTPTVNIFTTLVRHPGLFNRWMPFAGKLLTGKLPPRDRELLILRTGWRCGSEYEWGQHVLVGQQAGLDPDEIVRITEGPDADGWDPFDALLVRAADELHDDHCLTDATWAGLAERYDDKQMVEVPMVVGHYHLVSMTLNTLGVPLEDGVARWPT